MDRIGILEYMSFQSEFKTSPLEDGVMLLSDGRSSVTKQWSDLIFTYVLDLHSLMVSSPGSWESFSDDKCISQVTLKLAAQTAMRSHWCCISAVIEARESSSADDVSIRMSHCSQSVVDSMIYGIFDLFLECQDQKCEWNLWGSNICWEVCV